jgi:hypothetical protein
MTAVTSDEGIVNLALTRLGHSVISSIGESTKAGALAAVHYDATRDAVLRAHPWNFAIKRAELAQDDADNSEYAYQYALPSVSGSYCLKVLRTWLEAQGLEDDYRIEGRYLMSNETTVEIEYIARVLTVGQYDPLFIQVLALTLAARFAIPLTNNRSLLAECREELREIQPVAQSVDAQEGTPREIVDNRGWLFSRL